MKRDPLAAQPQSRDSQASGPELPRAVSDFRIVGIGASAGGLEACRRFLKGLPASPGMAFIIVQHLDPTHESLMAELLSDVTAMPVLQAPDSLEVEPNHVYLIPPGQYLAYADGKLSLSIPTAPHGARLPFDFLLQSLAASGNDCACIILSGGGADGSAGARAIKAAGGLVIAQDPAEASHPSMPNAAIATGAVDFIATAADMAALLLPDFKSILPTQETPGTTEIIALLKSRTTHDFTLYKTGTMERRIERRMSIAGIPADETNRYMDLLRTDDEECRQLASDLLINVTNFFRDPKIFALLAETTIPELIATTDGSIRLWVVGCSTGEETYSLAMLFLEQMESAKTYIKLQIFATDIDSQAVMQAREGLYSTAIEKDVTPARLAKYFTKDERGYQVSTSLRACMIFAVQDVLTDPPFSNLDMISCRNLLIYVRPEAQTKIIAVFHFALRPGGILLLGAAETVAAPDRGFAQISKPARLYRKTGSDIPRRLPPGTISGDLSRMLPAITATKARSQDIGEICRKLVLERYAPAALLINARLEILYSFGPVHEFLRPATGIATHDLLAQLPAAGTNLRVRVKAAVTANTLVRIGDARLTRNGQTRAFSIEIQPVPADNNKFLVCFFNQGKPNLSALTTALPPDAVSARISELEADLAITRTELQDAIQSLESTFEEHNAINEEALSVNEEFQSTNEELLTSKEELQSLNEELTALNSQLQESLERSRMTSTDLRNVLYSTDVPTLFLDEKLNIRFFTPSATALFHIIQSDVGRQLADFRSLQADPDLLAHAAQVLAKGTPNEFEFRLETGTWYLRRIQAYRTFDGKIAGVVITFNDITDRKAAAAALETARHESERANLAKSRFLAAASHDLRQPLQTMALINGMLGKTAKDPASQKLITRLDHTMQSIALMLNAMLDINQIEAGIVQPKIEAFEVNVLLSKLYDKFKDIAAAQGTELRVVPCALSIATDSALLEQMLTNLLSNALKYTKAGRVLLGCRRHARSVRIEVLDSGIGIAADQLQNIFEEYHQIDNPAREQSRGLGLGLSIVQRLGTLLRHPIVVHSVLGKGSVFSVEVTRARLPPPPINKGKATSRPAITPQNHTLLVIEDDPDISQLLKNFLSEEGFTVALAHDGIAAKKLVTSGAIIPDLILADFNLPGAQTGLAVAHDLRVFLHTRVPVIIMTGDISTNTLQLIAEGGCVQINKPMRLTALISTIERLLDGQAERPLPASFKSRLAPGESRTIYVVDDDAKIRDSMRANFEQAGKKVETFPDAESFLAALPSNIDDCCLLIDAALPGISGLQLLQKLSAEGIALPSIMITGFGDIAMAVQAMKAGASDFLEKPVNAEDLLATVRRVLDEQHSHQAIEALQREAIQHIAGLTPRQVEVMDRVLAGQPSKNIAADLGISQRTVENHRAAIMEKTGAKSIPALVRLAVLAAAKSSEGDGP